MAPIYIIADDTCIERYENNGYNMVLGRVL